jgi:riboflavin synthase
MFTGLVEAVGAVADVAAVPGGRRVRIRTALAPDLRPGDSLSVDGVCLTVTETAGEVVSTDVGPETARLTTLGTVDAGARVNLERAARADTRLGGHLVQGHVDATTTVDRLEAEGDSYWIGFALPPEFSHLLVPKGSVAVNGVSLTVAHLEATRFEVMIIPFTWEHTNMSALQVGSAVNLECDMVGKYVARAVEGYRNRW